MVEARLGVGCTEEELLAEELSQSVDQEVSRHWQEKITSGIVPTEVLIRGPVNWQAHREETAKLADFEVDVIGSLFLEEVEENHIGTKRERSVRELHYFGIGTGEALSRVATLANCFHYDVAAYDTCLLGQENGERVLKNRREHFHNRALLADILFACQQKYVTPGKARKLVISRVLHVLDKQEPDWERKAPSERKMARTLRRIGAELLPFLDVVLIHPSKEDNLNAKWGDTTPSSIKDIERYVSSGAKRKVKAIELGKVSFYTHVYTAVVLKGGK